jgi:hypothetical protein
MLLDQCRKLGYELAVPTEREVGVEALLEQPEPQLFEPRGLGLQRNVGERASMPETKRLPCELGATIVAPGRHGFDCLRKQPLGGLEIDGAVSKLELVAQPASGDPRTVRLDRSPQAGDIALERVAGRRGRLVSPELVDEPVDRHSLVRM